jgi:hypothetical protein
LDAHARVTQTPIRWPDIDMTAPVSGWTRFLPAEEWKKANIDSPTRYATTRPSDDLQATAVSGTSTPPQSLSPEKVELFRDFVEYQRQHASHEASRHEQRIKYAGN